MPRNTQAQKVFQKVDCSKLNGKATLVIEYKHLVGGSGATLKKIPISFDCQQSKECGVGKTHGDVTDFDWDSCPYYKKMKS